MILCLLMLLYLSPAMGYLETWGLSGGRPTQPTCVDIPRNMSLCHGIGYNKMRLPNLLDHDTMAEVSQQAISWVALNNIRCHPDTQLFLCSLFSPVCLDRPIYPCRSLCEKVRLGCEGRMKKYGFPWPEMFNCTKFPQDNDMCITPQSGAETSGGESIYLSLSLFP
ncbi:Secreted frizzled-related protein 5 [Blattella germanica]|nr:Secreted frizzled-related protein 5 [Blattella germanica]